MNSTDDRPIISAQTTAQNSDVETVLKRLENKEYRIPEYQRDSDEWDAEKKSLFIESVLNRLTVPAFYLAPREANVDEAEVIDGQQRLTTLGAFFRDALQLEPDDHLPVFRQKHPLRRASV